MSHDDSSPPPDTSTRPEKYLWVRLRHLLGLLTFVDLPIKQKFVLLTVGTLCWCGSMAIVTVLALTAIQ